MTLTLIPRGRSTLPGGPRPPKRSPVCLSADTCAKGPSMPRMLHRAWSDSIGRASFAKDHSGADLSPSHRQRRHPKTDVPSGKGTPHKGRCPWRTSRLTAQTPKTTGHCKFLSVLTDASSGRVEAHPARAGQATEVAKLGPTASAPGVDFLTALRAAVTTAPPGTQPGARGGPSPEAAMNGALLPGSGEACAKEGWTEPFEAVYGDPSLCLD